METQKQGKSKQTMFIVIAVVVAVLLFVNGMLFGLLMKKQKPKEYGVVSGYVTRRGVAVVSADAVVGGGIGNAEVIFTSADGDLTEQTVTDETGYFEYSLPEDDYTLTVRAEGYPEYTLPEPITVVAGQTTKLARYVALETTVAAAPAEADFTAMGTAFDAQSLLNTLAMTMVRRTSTSTDYAGPMTYEVDFQSETLDTAALKEILFLRSYSPLYAYFYGESGETDGGTVRFSEERLLWIAKNVLNMNGEFDRDVFQRGDADEGNEPCEYRDGYYYFKAPAFDYEFTQSRIKSRNEAEDGNYEFKVEYDFNMFDTHRDVTGEGTMVAGLKEVDGRRVWSVYSYTADIRYAPLNGEAAPETTAAPAATKAAETTQAPTAANSSAQLTDQQAYDLWLAANKAHLRFGARPNLDLNDQDGDYYRVAEDGVRSLSDLNGFLSQYFDETICRQMAGEFKELNGALYIWHGGVAADHLEVASAKVVSQTASTATVELTLNILPPEGSGQLTWTYTLENRNGRWIFTNEFRPVNSQQYA